jgi:hypothetical protein
MVIDIGACFMMMLPLAKVGWGVGAEWPPKSSAPVIFNRLGSIAAGLSNDNPKGSLVH